MRARTRLCLATKMAQLARLPLVKLVHSLGVARAFHRTLPARGSDAGGKGRRDRGPRRTDAALHDAADASPGHPLAVWVEQGIVAKPNAPVFGPRRVGGAPSQNVGERTTPIFGGAGASAGPSAGAAAAIVGTEAGVVVAAVPAAARPGRRNGPR